MHKKKAISVLIVDDHILFLEVLAKQLQQDSRFKITGKASNGTAAVEMAGLLRPDVVLLDINMGPVDGFEATRLIRNISPGSKIVALSLSAITGYARKIKALGGMGYLTKCCTLTEVKQAIVSVSRGKFFYCELIQNLMKKEALHEGDATDSENALTKAELKIIEMIKQGKNSQEIAKSTNTSKYTVYNHKRNIYKKMKVTSIISLLHLLQQKGM